jgi:hypothetical protein
MTQSWARLKLADALLSIASEESRDVQVLKKFQRLALDYRDRTGIYRERKQAATPRSLSGY